MIKLFRINATQKLNYLRNKPYYLYTVALIFIYSHIIDD
jgi:hypothetical protein